MLPSEQQAKDIDYMLATGELFTLIVYAQLILENSRIYNLEGDLLEQIFAFLVRDFSSCSLRMVLDYENSQVQETFYNDMIRKPNHDPEGFENVWLSRVYALKDSYTMEQ